MRLIAVWVCDRGPAAPGNVCEMTSFQFFPENVMTSVLEPCGTPFWVLVGLVGAGPDSAGAAREALATWRTVAAVSSTGARFGPPGAIPVPPALAASTATATAAVAAVTAVPVSTAARGSRRPGRGAPAGPLPAGARPPPPPPAGAPPAGAAP